MRDCKLNYLLPYPSSKTKAPAKTNAREMWNVAGKYSLDQSKRGSKLAWRETRSQAQLRWWAVSANKVVVIHDMKIYPQRLLCMGNATPSSFNYCAEMMWGSTFLDVVPNLYILDFILVLQVYDHMIEVYTNSSQLSVRQYICVKNCKLHDSKMVINNTTWIFINNTMFYYNTNRSYKYRKTFRHHSSFWVEFWSEGKAQEDDGNSFWYDMSGNEGLIQKQWRKGVGANASYMKTVMRCISRNTMAFVNINKLIQSCFLLEISLIWTHTTELIRLL